MNASPHVRRWLLAGAASALLAVTAAGCGGSSSSKGNDSGGTTTSSASSSSSTNADKWAESFCTYTDSWETSLKQTATKFKSSAKTTDSVNAALDSAKTSTTLFAHQLSALGTPPGAQNASGQLRTYAGRLKSSAENLKGTWSAPTSSATESAQKLAQLAGTLRTISLQLKEAGNYIKSLPSDSPARQALENNSTCTRLFAS